MRGGRCDRTSTPAVPILVHEFKDELRVLAVLVRQYVLALKYGRILTTPSIRREDILDDPLDVLPTERTLGKNGRKKTTTRSKVNLESITDPRSTGLTLAVLSNS